MVLRTLMLIGVVFELIITTKALSHK